MSFVSNFKNEVCECGVMLDVLDIDFRNDNKDIEIIIKCQNCGHLEARDYKMKDMEDDS